MKLDVRIALGLLLLATVAFIAGAAIALPSVVFGAVLMVLGVAGVAGVLYGVDV